MSKKGTKSFCSENLFLTPGGKERGIGRGEFILIPHRASIGRCWGGSEKEGHARGMVLKEIRR